jgi:uncharacterized membrane protein YkgB
MTLHHILCALDRAIIHTTRRAFPTIARYALAIIFIWFGGLKVLQLSPASPLVASLLEATLPFISFKTFIIAFGWFEVAVGIAFLMPKAERLAICLLFGHMITTVLPLILLPNIAWSGFAVPTLEGQYMIKNIALIALAIGIASTLAPLREHSRR